MSKKPLYPGDRGFQYLDDEEKQLIDEIEGSQWTSLPADELEFHEARAHEAARNTLAEIGTKSERMNIRMTLADMEALKAAAEREGLPYQSLVTSVLHKFTTGRLVDLDEARKVLGVEGRPEARR
ncbi:MAG: antitoxin [Spirochaetales bacterium]